MTSRWRQVTMQAAELRDKALCATSPKAADTCQSLGRWHLRQLAGLEWLDAKCSPPVCRCTQEWAWNSEAQEIARRVTASQPATKSSHGRSWSPDDGHGQPETWLAPAYHLQAAHKRFGAGSCKRIQMSDQKDAPMPYRSLLCICAFVDSWMPC